MLYVVLISVTINPKRINSCKSFNHFDKPRFYFEVLPFSFFVSQSFSA